MQTGDCIKLLCNSRRLYEVLVAFEKLDGRLIRLDLIFIVKELASVYGHSMYYIDSEIVDQASVSSILLGTFTCVFIFICK